MVIFGIAVGYLILGAWFYAVLTRTATDISLPPMTRPHKWLRPRRLRGEAVLRRLRPLLSLRLPKRSRKN